ncbi:asparaginase domain-containing protein [uncultured Algimonas sp.]|uniref:asparaginase domain-containing protein n=1 Tax=uncultured Algimonas sp. TaxID=1547920 RepID=UPI0026222687|nr:asparaginase domain-containing protein [uncultured Algimonas sp.]
MDVLILTTGGTLDKVHDLVREALVFDREEGSCVPAILAQARADFPRVEQLMTLDSLDMIDSDRRQLVDAILKAPETHIVIIHGTGTMGVTARFIAERVQDRTVVLTGAMRPHSLGRSDAGFNLGGAVVAAQVCAPGVYGVMNGRVIGAQELEKNRTTGRFA